MSAINMKFIRKVRRCAKKGCVTCEIFLDWYGKELVRDLKKAIKDYNDHMDSPVETVIATQSAMVYPDPYL